MHCLASVSALAFVCVGLVNGLEVGAQADLASAHLRDDRADCSVCANVCGERPGWRFNGWKIIRWRINGWKIIGWR